MQCLIALAAIIAVSSLFYRNMEEFADAVVRIPAATNAAEVEVRPRTSRMPPGLTAMNAILDRSGGGDVVSVAFGECVAGGGGRGCTFSSVSPF